MLAKQLRFIKWQALSMCLCFATYAGAQSTSTQNSSQDSDVARSAHDQDRDINHEELARFNQFLQTHPDTVEQLRKDPSLVNNQQFVSDHPALQSYLQDHPEVRQQLQQNPNAFMREEDRYEHQEAMNSGADFNRGNGSDRNGDRDHDAQHHFGEFLGSHSNIAEQLSRDPLVKSQEYLQDHPELQDYLSSHPEVRQ
jgi:hypothetical protein